MPELRSSPGAFFRLIQRPKVLALGVLIAHQLVRYAHEREGFEGLPAVSMPGGAALWLACFLIAGAAGVYASLGVIRQPANSETTRMLPALDVGLRRGLAVLAGTLGIAAGVAAVAMGHDPLHSMALGAFSMCVVIVLSWVTTWSERRFGLSGALAALPLLVLPAVWVLTPALPGRLEAAEPLATIGACLLLSILLLRHFPRVAARGNAEVGGGTGRFDASSSPAPAPLSAGAWTVAPIRSGLRFWKVELGGIGRGGRFLLWGQGLMGFFVAWLTGSGESWLFLVFLLVIFRVTYPAPLGSFTLPVGRHERARIAWAAEVLQAGFLVGGAACFLLLALLLDPARISEVPGPHPALVLVALAVCLPLNGAMLTALGVRFPAVALGRRFLSSLVVIALTLALIQVVDRTPMIAAWPLVLTAGFAGPAAAYLLFRRHLAHCPLGPTHA